MLRRTITVDRRDPIAITSQSIVASLGLDAETCCAAARAGVRRAQKLDYFRFNAPDNRGLEFATGHPAPLLTAGFEGAARLAQLALYAYNGLALADCETGGSTVGLYMSFPDDGRVSSGSVLIDDAEARDAFVEYAAEQNSPDHAPDRVVESLLKCTTGAAITCQRTTSCGHAGFAENMHAAITDLVGGRCRFAIVGCVDSLVDERTLWWLRSVGRLKSESNPTGLEPGEAAAFFVLERRAHASLRRAPVLSEILAVAVATESRAQIEGQTPLGQAATAAFRAVAAAAKADWGASPWIVTDHNGEPARAHEFGILLCRSSHECLGLAPAIWYPAVSFGDTGAASAGLAAAMVHRAYSRAYAPARCAIILSSSDGSARSAIALAHSAR